MGRLLAGTGDKPSLWQRVRAWAFTDVGVLIKGVDEASLQTLEEILLGADFGVPATLELVEHVEGGIRSGRVTSQQGALDAVAEEIRSIMTGHAGDPALSRAEDGPTVYVFAGVNGVGKTTTIGKLALRLKREGRRPLLAAADTFRAGAIDQLRIWAERVHVDFVGASPGADPAAVAFDAIDAAAARGCDVILIDTAGRLHTQTDLMKELAKIERVVARKLPGAPHETLLVLDATIGQNAVAQTRMFRQALRITGLVLAKLDSTARGGIVIALVKEFGIPVKLVGTGEAPEDLEPFDAARFAAEVVSDRD
jgi:fused signal recognition particle receptor